MDQPFDNIERGNTLDEEDGEIEYEQEEDIQEEV